VNDQPGHAEKLAALVRGRPALVNVIPYNPVEELPFRPPTAAATRRFVGILRQAGVNAQIRRRQGERIDAACGQLRRRGQMPGKLQGAAGVSF
jgi:23S rRNA (adenine2503-C2)-methyltransferase